MVLGSLARVVTGVLKVGTRALYEGSRDAVIRAQLNKRIATVMYSAFRRATHQMTQEEALEILNIDSINKRVINQRADYLSNINSKGSPYLVRKILNAQRLLLSSSRDTSKRKLP
eukprot:Trichotokara_eunicae@DN2918_c0_g1_i1.p1